MIAGSARSRRRLVKLRYAVIVVATQLNKFMVRPIHPERNEFRRSRGQTNGRAIRDANWLVPRSAGPAWLVSENDGARQAGSSARPLALVRNEFVRLGHPQHVRLPGVGDGQLATSTCETPERRGDIIFAGPAPCRSGTGGRDVACDNAPLGASNRGR